MENGQIVSDFAPKKLVRQLDFTTCCASENARQPVQLHSPPQQPSVQPRLHSLLESKSSPPPESKQRVQSQGQCQTQETSSSKQQPESPLQAQNVQSPSSLQARSHLQAMHQLLARHNQTPVSHRTPHPVQKLPQPTLQLGKQESPRSRLHSGIDAKDGTPKKQKQCNCKNSRCLKLYCECFAAGIYCDGCNCINCHNNSEKEEYRQEAISLTLERNPNAFRPKIGSSPHGPQDAKDNARELQMVGKHNKGCHCKKSGCLKKYCECFQAEVFCSENCKCMDCKNFEGSEERRASSQGYHNSLLYMQQAANAAINGAIGLSGSRTVLASKKRKGDEILFDQAVQDQSVPKMAQHQLENPSGNSPASSSVLSASVSCTPNAAVLRSVKPSLRSPLANVLKPQDVKELCSVLVILSSEAAKTLRGKNSERNMERDSCNVETAVLCTQAAETSEKGSDLIAADNSVPQNQADVDSNGISESNETNMRNGRPLSPGTRALMCEEENAMFLAASSYPALPSHCQNTRKESLNEHGRTEVYAEQERLVLASLRDVLNRLISCGVIKQTMCSSPDKRSQQKPVDNPAVQSVNRKGCHQEPCHKGIVRSLNPATVEMSHIAVSSPPANNMALKMGLPTGNVKIKADIEKSNTQQK